jgi:hypothetical protein
MGVFTNLRLKPSKDVTETTQVGNTTPVDDKTAHEAVTDRNDAESQQTIQPEDNAPTADAQDGVKEVEGVTLTWSKKTLIAVFCKYV